MTGQRALDPQTRIVGMTAVTQETQGAAVMPLFSEESPDLTFSDLLENFTTADAAGAAAPNGQLTTLNVNYAYAVLRDAQYMHAGRRYMKALGYQGRFRELYEGGKFGTDAAPSGGS